MVNPVELSAAVSAAVAACLDAGEFEGTRPAEVVVERPKSREHGDYATNVALRLAKAAGRPPREIAESIATRLRPINGIARVDVAGPGFLNITLAAGAFGELAATIVSGRRGYGHSDTLAGQRLNLEFVSANPTGPVHIGAIRWAAVGDALARLLQACGARSPASTTSTTQAARSSASRAPLREVANGGAGSRGRVRRQATSTRSPSRCVDRNPGVLNLPDEEQTEIFQRDGVELMFAEIKSSLAEFGVDFDV